MALKRISMVPPKISQASTADIAFLLLIFFISTTVFDFEFGIPLQLPPIEGRTKVIRDNVLILHATADGTVRADDNPVALRDLRGIIEQGLADNKDLVVSIETDGEAAYSHMVDVLDEVKAAKAGRISIKKRRD
ncbi:ExbD/TolR family protein [Candidatus Eisenbacteria bacterium]|uniref:ExbD/TolR family protein n=1 Tax=Eiseniibacteriota bacterium TaxID=2212470 RepID=A0ABV6YJW6_UNCEI